MTGSMYPCQGLVFACGPGLALAAFWTRSRAERFEREVMKAATVLEGRRADLFIRCSRFGRTRRVQWAEGATQTRIYGVGGLWVVLALTESEAVSLPLDLPARGER